MSSYEVQQLNDESRNNWNTNAEYWDQRIGEGNEFHLELVEPAQLPLLDLQPDGHRLRQRQFHRADPDVGAWTWLRV